MAGHPWIAEGAWGVNNVVPARPHGARESRTSEAAAARSTEALGAAREDLGAPGHEGPRGDVLASLGHQVEVEMQIVERAEGPVEDLFGAVQMAQVRAREVPARVAAALGVDGLVVQAESSVAEVEVPARAVNSFALRAWRVGITQSNMSTPRPTQVRRSSGVPTPIR